MSQNGYGSHLTEVQNPKDGKHAYPYGYGVLDPMGQLPQGWMRRRDELHNGIVQMNAEINTEHHRLNQVAVQAGRPVRLKPVSVDAC